MNLRENSVHRLAMVLCLAAAVFSGGATNVLAGANSDAALFATYDQVNSADIEIAELGVIKGASKEVRTVAAMVLRDHAAVRQMARGIAGHAGIEYAVPTDNETAKSHRATLERLGNLEGAEFDQAYLAHEAPFHRNAADAVRTVLIPGAKTPAFRAHLEAVLPHFEHHLNATLEAARALGYQTE